MASTRVRRCAPAARAPNPRARWAPPARDHHGVRRHHLTVGECHAQLAIAERRGTLQPDRPRGGSELDLIGRRVDAEVARARAHLTL